MGTAFIITRIGESSRFAIQREVNEAVEEPCGVSGLGPFDEF